MTKDCNIKRAKFISKVHSLNQEFYFAHPNTVIELYNIYACSFYGSNLWDLYNVNKLYSSLNCRILSVDCGWSSTGTPTLVAYSNPSLLPWLSQGK